MYLLIIYMCYYIYVIIIPIRLRKENKKMKDYTNAIEGTLQDVLTQLKDKYIKVDCAFGSEREEVKSGLEWLNYFQEMDDNTLTLNAIATSTETPFNCYDFNIETFEG
nr:MAG TPA: hypothetical protein [Caudoviricetes sp.]